MNGWFSVRGTSLTKRRCWLNLAKELGFTRAHQNKNKGKQNKQTIYKWPSQLVWMASQERHTYISKKKTKFESIAFWNSASKPAAKVLNNTVLVAISRQFLLKTTILPERNTCNAIHPKDTSSISWHTMGKSVLVRAPTFPNQARASWVRLRSRVHHSLHATFPYIWVPLIHWNFAAIVAESMSFAVLYFFWASAKLQHKHKATPFQSNDTHHSWKTTGGGGH